jgi:hypothetical protein
LVATHYEPPNLVSFTAVIPFLGDLIGGFTLAGVDGETRFSRWAELSQGGLRGSIGSFLAPVVRRSWGTELSNIKRLVEAQTNSTLESDLGHPMLDQTAEVLEHV